METLYSNGVQMDTSPEAMGELRDSSDALHDPQELRLRMAQDGYVFIRGLFPREEIIAARREILLKYAIIGEIDDWNHPLLDAIESRDSYRMHVNVRALSQSIRKGAHYQRITYHPELIGYYERLLGTAVRYYDFLWPRLVRPGEGCGLHYDAPYMNRGTIDELFTSWIPLGDISRQEGALIILEGSHLHEELRQNYALRDVDKEPLGWFSTDPVKTQRKWGGRWLTTDFKAGDMLSFGMCTMHGALDNHSPVGRCRLSSDSRYQSAEAEIDHRWIGEEPEAHGYDKVFFPGLGAWGNKDLQDEWKRIDERGRMMRV